MIMTQTKDGIFIPEIKPHLLSHTKIDFELQNQCCDQAFELDSCVEIGCKFCMYSGIEEGRTEEFIEFATKHWS